jgi:ABC-type multidrug transport system fused ATPase/permease subunit
MAVNENGRSGKIYIHSELKTAIRTSVNQNKYHFLFIVILIGMSAAFQALGPVALRELINSARIDHGNRALASTIIYVMMLFLARLSGAALAHQLGYAWRPMRAALISSIYSHIFNQNSRSGSASSASNINETVQNGISGLRSTIAGLILNLAPAFIQFFIMIMIIIHLGHEIFALEMMAFSFFYFIIYHRSTHTQISRYRNSIKSDSRIPETAIDALSKREIIRIYNAEKGIINNIVKIISESELHWKFYSRNQFINQIVMNCLFVAFLAAVLARTVIDVVESRISLGDMILINNYVFLIITPLERLSNSSREFMQGATSIDVLSRMLNSMQAIKDRRRISSGEGNEIRIAITELSYCYESGVKAVDNVSFALSGPGLIGIVGPSGSGKSTLWRLMMGLKTPTEGTIRISTPERVSNNDISSSIICAVPQTDALFLADMKENVRLWNQTYNDESLREAVTAACLDPLYRRIIGAPDLRLGDFGRGISAGEKQRVAIARALLRHPKILILDEATSALDAETEEKVLRNIRNFLPDSCIIVITHNLRIIETAGRILVMNNGRLVDEGVHTQLLASSTHYHRMWQANQDPTR